jgi:hypothetical protein
LLDYKRVIPSKNLRLRLLEAADFIPDSVMIKLQYWVKTGRRLDLRNPRRYTEKLQWYKLFYRVDLMTKCSDKYAVRQYVHDKGLGSILNPIIGVYEDVDSIDFHALPNSFACKHTNGSGANIFVTDKNEIGIAALKRAVSKLKESSKFKYGREWCYYNIPSRIIIERLLERDNNNDIPDYKFFCFDGKVKYLYVMTGYVDDHNNGRCSFFTPEFKKLPYRRSEYRPITEEVPKPENFEEMIEIAEILSGDFPHVRVDLYSLNSQTVFGEMTFYNAGGYTVFYPDEFDYILGREFALPRSAP